MQRYRNFRTFTTPDLDKLATLAIDPTCEIICSSSADTFEIFIWSIKTGQLLNKIQAHDGPISQICFSLSGDKIYTTGWDALIKIWSLENSKKLVDEYSLENDAEATAMAISRDNKMLVVAQSNCRLSFFEADKLSILYEFEAKPLLKQKVFELEGSVPKTRDIFITSLCFSQNSKFLIICSNTPKILIYSLISQTCVKELILYESLENADLHSSFFKTNMEELQRRLNPVFRQDRTKIPLPGNFIKQA